MSLQSLIINGLLRYGETAHFTGNAKSGKGWLLYDLAIAATTGGPWLEQFRFPKSKVLIIEAKCSRETMIFRLDSIVKARCCESTKGASACCARGKTVGLQDVFREAREADLVFINGLDRILPPGMSYEEADAAIREFTQKSETGWMDTRWEWSRTGGIHLNLSRAPDSEDAILQVQETPGTETEVPITWRCPLWRPRKQ